MTAGLFDDVHEDSEMLTIAPGAWLLRGFARNMDAALLEAFDEVTAQAPLRHQVTPGGHTMSVAMSNCGPFGWVSDRRGYRYLRDDPLSGHRWPAIPPLWRDLAVRAAEQAGYESFEPDACLINRYEPGAKLSLHQDRDEKDLGAPIVSVSLGVPAVFQFGTADRQGKLQNFRLVHGDVVVWGGESRLAYHGVLPLSGLAGGHHEMTGKHRINLTFRKTGLFL